MNRPVIVYDEEVHSLQRSFGYNPEETAALRQLFGDETPITPAILFRTALWKLNRIIGDSEAIIQNLEDLRRDHLILDHRHEKVIQLLETLVKCRGVGYPMATTFLKFARPDVFPIIDVRAYRALFGQNLKYHQYNTKTYLQFADRCKEISKNLGISLADVDEQLYAFDKELNGRINR